MDDAPVGKRRSDSLIGRCFGPDARWSPAKSLVPYTSLDDLLQCWCSQFLEVFGEPALRESDPAERVYRLLVLPSFSSATMVRIESVNHSARLKVARSVGRGGYLPVAVAECRDRTLTAAAWRQLVSLASTADFWTHPKHVPVGLDGSEWVLETRHGDHSNVLAMWQPSLDGPWKAQRVAADLMLSLADVSESR